MPLIVSAGYGVTGGEPRGIVYLGLDAETRPCYQIAIVDFSGATTGACSSTNPCGLQWWWDRNGRASAGQACTYDRSGFISSLPTASRDFHSAIASAHMGHYWLTTAGGSSASAVYATTPSTTITCTGTNTGACADWGNSGTPILTAPTNYAFRGIQWVPATTAPPSYSPGMRRLLRNQTRP
jgi:hypothetical protein